MAGVKIEGCLLSSCQIKMQVNAEPASGNSFQIDVDILRTRILGMYGKCGGCEFIEENGGVEAVVEIWCQNQKIEYQLPLTE